MKNVCCFIILMLSLQLVASSQVSRKEIIANKIKSVEKTYYTAGFKLQTKTYYSVDGYDSIHIIPGNIYYYSRVFDDRGRVMNLVKKTPKGEMISGQTISYTGDSLYTLRQIDGQGNISVSLCKINGDALWRATPGKDTLFFIYDTEGKLIRTDIAKEGKREVYSINEYDKKGYLLRQTTPKEKSTQFVYKANNKGLITESRSYMTGENEKKAELGASYKYEYY